jgi:hypothetical protein
MPWLFAGCVCMISLRKEEDTNLKKQIRPLVESYARTWPREVIEFLNDRQAGRTADVASVTKTLEQPGVYVLFKDDVPHYAGKATNLRKRLLTHMRIGGRYANLWNHVSFFIIHDEAHRNAVESIVIASIGNAANSAKPRIKKIPVPARALKKWQKQNNR